MYARLGVAIAGLFALVVAGTLLVLWLSGDPELVRIAAWRGKTNTCIGLILGATSLLLFLSRRPAAIRIAQILAIAVIALGGLTLLQYIAGIDLGLDELVARDWPFAESAAHPNRMAPNAAVSFVLLGPVLLLAARPRRLAELGQVLAFALLAVDAAALIGYLYDATFLYQTGKFLRISPYAAACFVALAAGSLALRPELGMIHRLSSKRIGSYLARRLLIPVLVMPIVLGWLRIEGDELGWWTDTTGGVLEVLVYIGVFGLLVMYLARSLDGIDARREQSDLELRRAAELTSALAQARTVEEVAKVTVELGVPALGADAGTVYLLDRGDTELRLIASIGHPTDVTVPFATVPISAALPLCDAVRARASVFVASAEELGARYPGLAGRGASARAWAAVPLEGRERMLGVIGISFHARPPTPEARTRIDHLTWQCGQALDRAALFDSERAARDVARAANRAKDEFLAMLGHELRNPLAPITHALELLKLRHPESHHEREVIERQVRHMTRLVDDLLDVSRITGGKVELSRSRVELASVVDNAIELVRPLIDDRRHTLVVDVGPALAVDGDRARLVQIVSNLLNNAARYTPPGGRIELVTDAPGDDIVLRVSDTGSGIPAALLPTLFEPFVQGERTLERAMGGLGLGLAIVHSLVTLHGGTITVASDGEGKGATFTVTLPAAARAAEPAPPPPAAEARPVAERRVLIVDDNQDAADLMGEALQLAGHAVQIAHDGPGGLEAAAAFDPDCVLLDIGLPGLDGYEVARRLRSAGGRRCTLIAMTGYGQKDDIRRAMEAGFDRHFVKPVSLQVALEVIANSPTATEP